MDDGYANRLRRRRYREQRRREHMRRGAAMACIGGGLALCLCMVVAIPRRSATVASAAVADVRGCRASMAWPVADAHVVGAFDPPPQPWDPGHRGVDLAVELGGDLLAPADGIIAFSGTVAGKSVVTIRHGRLTSTFEPAQTALPAGSRIGRGDRFATVAGESDHCGESCVHWGVRGGDERYLDPVGQAETRKIVLKPVTET